MSSSNPRYRSSQSPDESHYSGQVEGQADGWSAILNLSFWIKVWGMLLDWWKSISVGWQNHSSLPEPNNKKVLINNRRDLVIMKNQVNKYAKSVSKSLLNDQEIKDAMADAQHNSDTIKWLSGVFIGSLLSKINLASPVNGSDNIEVKVNADDGNGFVSETELLKMLQATCLLHPPNNKGSGFIAHVNLDKYGLCTVLVTNNHILKTENIARSSTICLYGHNDDVIPLSKLLKKDSFFKCSSKEELDYAVVELDEKELERYDKNIKPIKPLAAINHEDRINRINDEDIIHIFQHPEGKEKVYLSSSRCYVYDTYVVYEGGTKPGSSGSPIMKEVDGRLRVVGLHRSGYENKKPCFNAGSLFSEILHNLNGKELQPRQPVKITVKLAQRIHEELKSIYGDYKPAKLVKEYKDSKENITLKAGQEVLAKTTEEENVIVYFGGATITIPISYIKWQS